MGNQSSSIDNSFGVTDAPSFGATRPGVIDFSTGDYAIATNFTMDLSTEPRTAREFTTIRNVPVKPIPEYPEINTLAKIYDTFGADAISNFKIELLLNGILSGWNCLREYAVNLTLPNTSRIGGFWSVRYTGPDAWGVDTGWKQVYSGATIPLNNGYFFALSTVCGLCSCDCKSPCNWREMNFYMRVSGTINVAGFCLTNLTKSDICKQYCLSPFNENCQQNVINNCFEEVVLEDETITNTLFTEDVCKDWIKERANRGGSTEIDQKISETCNTLGINPSNYTVNLDTQQICACHFDPQVYDKFYKSLIQKYPPIQYAGLGSPKCLFPGCPTSPYKTVDILGDNTCPATQCIQGISLDIQGTVRDSDISIIQSAECASVTGDKICTTDTDCPLGLKCNQQRCKKPCVTTADCVTSYRCNPTTRFCERTSSTGPGPSPAPSTQNTGVIITFVTVAIIVILIIGFVLFILAKKPKTTK